MDGYREAEHQAAGHKGALVDGSGSLFIKPTTQQEIDFYTAAQERAELVGQSGSEHEDEGSRLTDWMPVFLGTLQPGISESVEASRQVTDEMKRLQHEQEHKAIVDPKKRYVVLQNLLSGFRKPSIIDIKLGAVLYDESTADEKKQRLQEVSQSTTSGSLHYRVCGMKLYGTDIPPLDSFKDTEGHVAVDEEGYIIFDKWYGRALTPENVTENFKLFFTHNKLSLERQQIVIRNMFTRLQLLFNCLVSEEVRIVSGSVFMAYENDLERWEDMQDQDPVFRDDLAYEDDDEDEEEDDDDEIDQLAPLSLLSMIDFAHSKFTPEKGPDENIIVGVENLLGTIEELIEAQK